MSSPTNSGDFSEDLLSACLKNIKYLNSLASTVPSQNRPFCCCANPNCSALKAFYDSVSLLEEKIRISSFLGLALLDRYQNTVNSYESQKKKMIEVIDVLEVENQGLILENRSLTLDNKELLSRLEKLSGSLEISDAKIEALNTQNSNTKDLITQLSICTAQIEILENQLIECEKDRESLLLNSYFNSKRNNTLATKYEKLNKDLYNMSKRYDDLKSKVNIKKDLNAKSPPIFYETQLNISYLNPSTKNTHQDVQQQNSSTEEMRRILYETQEEIKNLKCIYDDGLRNMKSTPNLRLFKSRSKDHFSFQNNYEYEYDEARFSSLYNTFSRNLDKHYPSTSPLDSSSSKSHLVHSTHAGINGFNYNNKNNLSKVRNQNLCNALESPLQLKPNPYQTPLNQNKSLRHYASTDFSGFTPISNKKYDFFNQTSPERQNAKDAYNDSLFYSKQNNSTPHDIQYNNPSFLSPITPISESDISSDAEYSTVDQVVSYPRLKRSNSHDSIFSMRNVPALIYPSSQSSSSKVAQPSVICANVSGWTDNSPANSSHHRRQLSNAISNLKLDASYSSNNSPSLHSSLYLKNQKFSTPKSRKDRITSNSHPWSNLLGKLRSSSSHLGSKTTTATTNTTASYVSSVPHNNLSTNETIADKQSILKSHSSYDTLRKVDKTVEVKSKKPLDDIESTNPTVSNVENAIQEALSDLL